MPNPTPSERVDFQAKPGILDSVEKWDHANTAFFFLSCLSGTFLPSWPSFLCRLVFYPLLQMLFPSPGIFVPVETIPPEKKAH